MTAIAVSRGGVRVGSETRPAPFMHHDINGYHFRGEDVSRSGQWESWPWTDREVADYRAHLAAYRSLASWRVLRPIAMRIRSWQAWADPWDYDDEGDYRQPTPGLRGLIARRTPIVGLAASLIRATTKPTSVGGITIRDCHMSVPDHKEGAAGTSGHHEGTETT